MKKNHLISSILYITLVNTACALPWSPKSPDHLIHPTPFAKQHSTPANFSGTWVGECMNHPSETFTIIHKDDKFTISYGYMKEDYTIGSIKDGGSTAIDSSEHGITSVSVVNSNTLIFLNTSLFRNDVSESFAFFSKVAMQLTNDTLTIKGDYITTSDKNEAFVHDELNCSYKKQP